MIIDKETNYVYFSKYLESDFHDENEKIIKILKGHGIEYDHLESTADIWCRDYMPIQKNINSFVQFRYEPSYLRDLLEYQSDPKAVCLANNFSPEYCDEINLDGGNVIKWKDKVIVTERIFSENKIEKNDKFNQTQLTKKLEKVLDVEVLTIPVVKKDYTGHADGYVRFYDGNTILVNRIDQEYQYWQDGFEKMRKQYGFKIIQVPWFIYKDKDYDHPAIGCYMNFLEVGNLIILPIFDVKDNKDDNVINLFNEIYPERDVVAVNINKIGCHGGLMNCISWNIKTK